MSFEDKKSDDVAAEPVATSENNVNTVSVQLLDPPAIYAGIRAQLLAVDSKRFKEIQFDHGDDGVVKVVWTGVEASHDELVRVLEGLNYSGVGEVGRRGALTSHTIPVKVVK